MPWALMNTLSVSGLSLKSLDNIAWKYTVTPSVRLTELQERTEGILLAFFNCTNHCKPQITLEHQLSGSETQTLAAVHSD